MPGITSAITSGQLASWNSGRGLVCPGAVVDGGTAVGGTALGGESGRRTITTTITTTSATTTATAAAAIKPENAVAATVLA